MKATTLGTMVLGLILVANVASAQSARNWKPARGATLVQHHASTWTEGFLRGRADLARAAGQYNYNTALSMVAAEQARSQNIDNNLKATQTYYEKRRLHAEDKKANARPKPSAQQLKRIAKSRVPKRLDALAYNRAAGKLNWPEILRNDVFAPERNAIDHLVRERSKTAAGDEQLQLAAGQMMNVLKANIRALSPAEYIKAKSFLTSLQYEARFAAGSGHVAAR